MKPLIFEPEFRPTLFIKQANSATEISSKVAEIDGEYILTVSSEPLPLSGELKFEQSFFPYKKIEEEKLDDLYYTHLKINQKNGSELYKSLLLRLPTEDLSSWLLQELKPKEKIQDNLHRIDTVKESYNSEGFITNSIEWITTNLYRRPWLSVALLCLLSIFPGYHIKNLRVDPSLDRVLVHGSPEMLQYKESLKIFGSDKSATLLVEDKNLFDLEKLKILRKLAWEFQRWEEIERVSSVFTSSFIRNDGETLFTSPLFEELPFEESNLKTVQDDPILHGRLINVPKKNIVFQLKISPKVKKIYEIADKIDEVISPHKDKFDVFIQTGEPAGERYEKEEMASTPKIFMPLISIILFLGFYFFVKSIHAFIITIVVTGLSLFWSFGTMTYFGIPLQIMINMILGITLTLSATEIVHLATSLKTGWKKGYLKEDAVSYMARDIGKAVFLTFSSTALGFLSITLSDILMLREFGIVSSLSLFLVFVATIIYLPLHFRIFDFLIERKESEDPIRGQIEELKIFEKLRVKFYGFYLKSFFSKYPLLILIAFLLIHLFYSKNLHMDNDTFEMLADRTQIKKNIRKFRNEVGGLKEIHLVIESPDKLLDPIYLNYIWSLQNKIKRNDQATDVNSIAGLIALLNREMTDGSQENYRVPNSKNLISQYLLSLSRDDVDPFISPDKHKANIRISHDIDSSIKTEQFLSFLKSTIEESKGDLNLSYYFTSRNVLNVHAGNTIIRSQTLSLFTMSIVVILIMTLFFRSLKVGFISLIPNLIPIIGLFGLMGFLDIPLNVGTCIVAAITIGIAADDTIHLFTRFFKERNHELNPFETGRGSINEELVPILTTSLSLALSFATFTLSTFIPMAQFGILSAYVLILAVISDLYVGPWIVTFFEFKRLKANQHKMAYLLDGRAWSDESDLGKISFLELINLFKVGKFSVLSDGSINPKEDTLTFLLKGDGKFHQAGDLLKRSDTLSPPISILIDIPKQKIRNLSPRIFEKFCNNLED